MSDPRCMHQNMMEMDIESPYGEMDIEPGELDIEGPMAFHMLKNMGVPNITDSHFPEITLNNHVLEAMQKRFGVNTTAGIQRMSSNPEFQAFMYQVLTHSNPVSLAEFNANLSKAAVDRIMASLDSSAPNHRLAAGNLNYAQLNPQGASRDGASLTLDNHPTSNIWANMGNPFGLPMAGNAAPLVAGNAAPLVQNPEEAIAAQPGTFQALVQQPRGEGQEGGERGRAETGEAPEAKERGNTTTETGTEGTKGTDLSRTAKKQTAQKFGPQATSTVSPVKSGLKATAHSKSSTTNANVPAQTSTQAKTQPQPQPTARGTPTEQHPPVTNEQDIVGKDNKQGLSKDQKRKIEKQNTRKKTVPQTNPDVTVGKTNPNGNAGTSNTQVNTGGSGGIDSPSKTDLTQTGPGGNTGPAQTESAGKNDPSQTVQGTKTNSIPTGIQEAGLVPDVTNNTVPGTAETGYSSTGFAIAAGTIIALIIILGPIACMLWKMREKHAEKLRKQKAHKNRDMSENSIMESMVLHDFGKGNPNSVTNEAAEATDYYSYGKKRYTTINTDLGEIDRLSGNPESPRGRLP